MTAAARSELLADFSLGMTGKEVGALEQARTVIPPATRVHVGFVDSENLTTRLTAARAVKRSGFIPVPIIAARRLRSEKMLREYLSGLQTADASDCVLVVAGDPAQPRGPYPDAVPASPAWPRCPSRLDRSAAPLRTRAASSRPRSAFHRMIGTEMLIPAAIRPVWS